MAPSDPNMQAFYDVAYLASCAVREVAPDPELVAAMDLGAVYREADRQLLASCCSFALQDVGMCTEDFEQAQAIAIRRTIFMDQQRREVLNRLEEAGIWYLPLKGIVLKDYYPKVGMREMSDNDILFDASRTEGMRAIMAELGFKADHLGIGAHDCFYKEPIYNFEMHRALFDGNLAERLSPYYENILERLMLDDGKRYGYHFSPEDFYLYAVAHEFKHYCSNGAGLRSCIDTYVYLSSVSLDMDYISREATKMGIADFEQTNRDLSLSLVNGEMPTKSELHILDHMHKAGVYGNPESRVEHKVAEGGGGTKGKLSYALHRIFPSMAQIKSWHPFFYQHKALLPLLPFIRLGKAVTSGRSRASREIRALFKS